MAFERDLTSGSTPSMRCERKSNGQTINGRVEGKAAAAASPFPVTVAAVAVALTRKSQPPQEMMSRGLEGDFFSSSFFFVRNSSFRERCARSVRIY